MFALAHPTLVSLAFFASQATAHPRATDTLINLSARQTGISPSDFPPQCQTGCTSVLTTIIACGSEGPSCICTAANVAAIQSCVSCIASTNTSSSIIAESASIISTFNNECSGQGVASLTVGTASPSNTGASGGSVNAAGATVVVYMAGLVGAGVLGLGASFL